MKKTIIALGLLSCITMAIMLSCTTPVEEVANAENHLKEANKDLDKANEAYLQDIANYRKETANKIEANNKSIAEFKARKERDKKNATDDYNKKIAELEQKNSDSKKKLDEYKAESRESWEKFKSEFGHDMDELGKAFNDFTIKNVK